MKRLLVLWLTLSVQAVFAQRIAFVKALELQSGVERVARIVHVEAHHHYILTRADFTLNTAVWHTMQLELKNKAKTVLLLDPINGTDLKKGNTHYFSFTNNPTFAYHFSIQEPVEYSLEQVMIVYDTDVNA